MVVFQTLCIFAFCRTCSRTENGINRHIRSMGFKRLQELSFSYYDKMPEDIANRTVLVVDPMLATGGSIISAVTYLRSRGVTGEIKLMVLVAAPEGIDAVLAADDNVHIYTCAIDEGLNSAAYIVPGLGDAGDRIFGTK